jgi:hypothetical protein
MFPKTSGHVGDGLPPLEGESVYQCWWSDPQTGEMVPGTPS